MINTINFKEEDMDKIDSIFKEIDNNMSEISQIIMSINQKLNTNVL